VRDSDTPKQDGSAPGNLVSALIDHPVSDGFDPSSLSHAQHELIAYFADLADRFSLPRSAGQIYGFLFGQSNPVPFEGIVAALGISKGSASGSLKLLRQLNAVIPKHALGDRRTFYEAETSIRQLVRRFLHDGLGRHLEDSQARIRAIESLLTHDASPDLDSETRSLLEKRLASLDTWHAKARRLVPWIVRLVSRKPRVDDSD